MLLRYLELSYNQLQQLPENFGDLHGLQRLGASPDVALGGANLLVCAVFGDVHGLNPVAFVFAHLVLLCNPSVPLASTAPSKKVKGLKGTERHARRSQHSSAKWFPPQRAFEILALGDERAPVLE